MIKHPINPVYDKNSKILILGSFPSVKSREEMFFYGHKQNRFWKVTSAVFECKIPNTTDEKRAFLLKNGIAVWDVIGECDIVGSADSTIKNVIPNDISKILAAADIKCIYTNGKTAKMYYDKHIKNTVGREAVVLPSTSPANAAWSFEKLVESWKVIKGQKFKPSFLEKVCAVQSDEYYVNMMGAWYFATALAKQYDEAVRYITENRLDTWTHNKTIQKSVESYCITKEQNTF